jgi:hypothetical protein
MMPFRIKETYGWTLPVVGERSYQFRFRSLVDWRTARIRYSEPEYVQSSEWLDLSSNFSDFRLQFEVLYGYQKEFRTWKETSMVNGTSMVCECPILLPNPICLLSICCQSSSNACPRLDCTHKHACTCSRSSVCCGNAVYGMYMWQSPTLIAPIKVLSR